MQDERYWLLTKPRLLDGETLSAANRPNLPDFLT